MELVIKDTKNKINISDAILKFNFNEALIHQVIVAYMAGFRQGTKAQKNRSQVTGSNKKPWRQKGTGRARAGSVKSPIWRSGGVTFAAKTKNFKQKINKKMYQGAIKSILSELLRQNRLIIVENLFISEPKTKILIESLKKINCDNALIIVDDISNNNLYLAARNIHKIRVQYFKNINPINLILFHNVIMTTRVIKYLEEILL